MYFLFLINKKSFKYNKIINLKQNKPIIEIYILNYIRDIIAVELSDVYGNNNLLNEKHCTAI